MSPTPVSNHQVRLARRPMGPPTADHWTLDSEPLAEPGDGEVLVQTLLLSLDPAMRGWMNEGRSYVAPVPLGGVMRAGGIGRVIGSRNPAFAVGDVVHGMLGVQEYARFGAADVERRELGLIDPGLGSPAQWLNVLGMPGMTAYFGLLDIARPLPGQTVVVSGAAGAVGQTVGQLARVRGARAVGIAGGPRKCAWVVDELGFDACIDYKDGTQAVREGLKAHCPKGVDVYFDNVGGEILDTVLTRLAMKARVVVCGAISQYNNANSAPTAGPRNYLSLLVNRARMEGMVVFDYAPRYPEAVAELAGHLAARRILSREDVIEGGVARFPEALAMLFAGRNLGKLILRVAD